MVMRLTELSGLDAFIDDGMHAGIIEDVAIDTETGKITGVAMGKVDEDFLAKMDVEGGRGIIVPYGAVKSVKDIVLLKDIVYRPKE